MKQALSILAALARPGIAGALLASVLSSRAHAVPVVPPCAADADPCVVSSLLVLAPDAVLDVGLRRLRVEGRIDVSGHASVLAGGIEVVASSAGLRLLGDWPLVELVARGRCSAAALPCLDDAACEAVSAGVCEAAAATLEVAAPIAGNGARPGQLRLHAAGHLLAQAALSAGGTQVDSDGGDVELRSHLGDVEVSGKIDVGSGGLGYGGGVRVVAAGDVVIAAPLVAGGGDGGGGRIDITAQGDVRTSADLQVGAGSGSGSGGELWIQAGRDLEASGGTATRSVVLGGDGHQSSDGSGGDGASVLLEAGRDLRVSRYVRLASAGAAPDGFGDEVVLEAGRDVSIEGRIDAPGRGAWSAGGLCEITAGGRLAVAPTASFDLAGPSLGGDLLATAEGPAEWAGDVDVRAAGGGMAGRVAVESTADLVVAGEWRTAGDEAAVVAGSLDAAGCSVLVEGEMTNAAAGGINRVAGRERVVLAAGAAMRATGEGAANVLRVRDGAEPPSILGTAQPLPLVEADAALEPCPACRGGTPEEAGTCIDGTFCAAAPSCEGDDCAASSAAPPGAVKVRLRAAPDRAPVAKLKVVLADAVVGASPGGLALRAVFSDEAGAEGAALLVDATLPAGALAPHGRAWRHRAETGAGIVDALVRRDEASGATRLRLRVEDAGLAQVPGAGAARASVLVAGQASEGTAEVAAACASSPVLACRMRGGAAACATPP